MASILRRNRPLRALLLLTYARFATVGAASVLYLSLAQSSGLGVTRSGALFWAFGIGGLLSISARKMVIGRTQLASRLVFFGCLSSAAWLAIAFTTESPVAILVFVAISGFGGSIYFGDSTDTFPTTRTSRRDATHLERVPNERNPGNSQWGSGDVGRWHGSTSVHRRQPCAATILYTYDKRSARNRRCGRRASDGDWAAQTQCSSSLAQSRGNRESLARRCEVRNYQDSALVIREGDVGTEVFVIVDGACDAPQSGKQIRRMVRGEIFGEIAVLSNSLRTASVLAVGLLVVLVISKEDFVNVVSLHEGVHIDAQTLMSERP